MHKIEPGMAQVLKISLTDSMMQDKINEWVTNLETNDLTEEMLRVFIALHWLTPRDPRVEKAAK